MNRAGSDHQSCHLSRAQEPAVISHKSASGDMMGDMEGAKRPLGRPSGASPHFPIGPTGFDTFHFTRERRLNSELIPARVFSCLQAPAIAREINNGSDGWSLPESGDSGLQLCLQEYYHETLQCDLGFMDNCLYSVRSTQPWWT